MSNEEISDTESRQPSMRERYPRDISRVLILRLAGAEVSAEGSPRLRRDGVALFGLASLAPVILAVIVPGWHRPAQGESLQTYYLWLLYFTVLDAAAVSSAWFACLGFYRITPDLDQAFTVAGHVAYNSWANATLDLRRQIRLMTIFGLVGAISLFTLASSSSLHGHLYISPASYMAVGWASALASNCGHWLLHGTNLSRAVTAKGRINLLWLAPARTPAVESLARVYRTSFYIASAGVSLYLVPIFTWSRLDALNTGAILLAKVVLVIASGLVALAIAIVPQIALSVAVIRERKASIYVLQRKLSLRDEDFCSDISVIGALIKTVTDSPQTTVNDRTIVALLLGLTAATLPALVQLYIK